VSQGVREKTIALDYAKMLGHFFRELGYTVVLTRKKDVTLTDRYRSSIAQRGDVLISCHTNGFKHPDANGLEVWYRTGIIESKSLAEAVYEKINELDYFRQRGIKGDKTRYPNPDPNSGGLYMLRHAAAAGCKLCILIEPGFLTNPGDRATLTTTKKRNLIAQAIRNGVHEYLEANKDI